MIQISILSDNSSDTDLEIYGDESHNLDDQIVDDTQVTKPFHDRTIEQERGYEKNLIGKL